MISKLRIGITLFLILIIATLSWLYRAEIKESATLAQRVIQQNLDLQQMENELQKAEQLRKKAEEIARNHGEKLKVINQETQRLKNEIIELENKSKEVAIWSDTPMPDSILNILCNSPDNNKNSEGLCDSSTIVPDEISSSENTGKQE